MFQYHVKRAQGLELLVYVEGFSGASSLGIETEGGPEADETGVLNPTACQYKF